MIMKLFLKNMLMLRLKKYVRKNGLKEGELDTSMFEFCKQTKEDDYEEYQVFFKRIEVRLFSSYQTSIVEINGLKEIVVDISMVKYCLNKEKEGYLDIKYIISKHGIDAENKSKELLSEYKKYSNGLQIKKIFR